MIDPIWRLDADIQSLRYGERFAHLTHQSTKVAAALMAAKGQIVSRDTLWRAITSESVPKIIDVYISKIRRACKDAGMPNPILTVSLSGVKWPGETEVVISKPVLLVPPWTVEPLRRLLGSHPNESLAYDVRYAIFGV